MTDVEDFKATIVKRLLPSATNPPVLLQFLLRSTLFCCLRFTFFCKEIYARSVSTALPVPRASAEGGRHTPAVLPVVKQHLPQEAFTVNILPPFYFENPSRVFSTLQPSQAYLGRSIFLTPQRGKIERQRKHSCDFARQKRRLIKSSFFKPVMVQRNRNDCIIVCGRKRMVRP